MNKQKIRKAVKIALLLGAITSPITTQPLIGKGELVEKLVASGVIENKHSVDYRCGSKGRSTCTDYIFTVNGVESLVNAKTFSEYTVGQEVTLTKTIDNSRAPRDWSLLEWLMVVFGVISLFIVVTVALGTFALYLYWLLLSDTKLSFKDWNS